VSITPGTISNEDGVSTVQTEILIDAPSGITTSHYLLALVQGNNNTAPPDQDGWTTLRGSNGTGLYQAVYGRFHDGSADYLFDGFPSARLSGQIMPYLGVDPTTPIDVTIGASSAGTTDFAWDNITPVTAGAYIVGLVSVLQSLTTTYDIASHNFDNQRGTTLTPSGGADAGGAIFDKAWFSGVFSPSVTSTEATTRTRACVLALRPAELAEGGGHYAETITVRSGMSLVDGIPNEQPNSSFESGTSDWGDQTGPAATLDFPSTAGAPDGTYAARLSVSGTGTPAFRATGANRIPITSGMWGDYLTAYGQFQWGTGTPGAARIDVQFMDVSDSVIQTNIGLQFFAATDSWLRVQQNNNQIPTDAAWGLIRIAMPDAVPGVSLYTDCLHAVIGADIPDLGPHPAWVEYGTSTVTGGHYVETVTTRSGTVGPAGPAINRQRNASFESGLEYWDTSGPAAISFPTDTYQQLYGARVARLRSTSDSATPQMRSTGENRVAIDESEYGLYLNAYANFRWESGTPKGCRMDVQFLDETDTVVQSNIGTEFTPSAGSWVRILNNDNVIPDPCHEMRLRFVIIDAQTNDSILIEDLYVDVGTNIHNDGPHPEWALHSEDFPYAAGRFFQLT